MAATTGFGFIPEPPTTEEALEFIRLVFSNPTIGQIAGSINSMALAVMALLLVYATVYGVMSTASKGKVMGDEGRTTWVVPRFLFAFVIVAPLSSGWGVGQEIIIKISQEAVKAGAHVWHQVQRNIPTAIGQALLSGGARGSGGANTAGDGTSISPSQSVLEAHARSIVYKELNNAVCRAEVSRMLSVTHTRSETSRSIGNGARELTYTWIMSSSGSTNLWSLGGLASAFRTAGQAVGLVGREVEGLPQGVCGSVHFQLPSSTTSEIVGQIAEAQKGAFFGTVETQVAEIARRRVAGQTNAYDSLGPLDYTAINTIIRNYMAAIVDATQRAIDNSPLQPVSWTLAGTRWNEMSRQMAVLHSSFDTLPYFTDANWEMVRSRTERNRGANQLSRVESHQRAIQDGFQAGLAAAGQSDSTLTATPEPTRALSSANLDDRTMAMRAVRFVLSDALGALPTPNELRNSLSNPESALQKIVNGGYRLMSVGGIMWVGGAAMQSTSNSLAMRAASLTPKGAILSALGDYGGQALKWIGGSAFIAGFTLAAILPAAPAAFWMLAVFGFLLLVWKTVLAVPVWAMAHLRMEGDGWIPSAAQAGWIAILRIIITPPLAVIAIIVSYTLFAWATLVVMLGYWSLIGDMTKGQFGPLAFFIAMGVFVMLVAFLLTLAWTAFSLPRTLPEVVLDMALGSSGNVRNEDQGNNVIAGVNMRGAAPRMNLVRPRVPGGSSGGGGGGVPKLPT